jgi:hypothetical protein
MYLSVFEPGRGTDAQNMAAAAGGFIPAIVWAIGWVLVSLGILGGTLFVYYKSLRESAVEGVPLMLPERPLTNDRIPLVK